MKTQRREPDDFGDLPYLVTEENRWRAVFRNCMLGDKETRQSESPEEPALFNNRVASSHR